MAFGDAYAYKTNSRFVVALAESGERDRTVGGDTVKVVDLVLHGFANGRRNNTIVGTVEEDAKFSDLENNVAYKPEDVAEFVGDENSVAPGETTASHVVTGYQGGADTPA